MTHSVHIHVELDSLVLMIFSLSNITPTTALGPTFMPGPPVFSLISGEKISFF